MIKDLPDTFNSPTMSPECADNVKYQTIDKISEIIRDKYENKIKIADQEILSILTINGIRFNMKVFTLTESAKNQLDKLMTEAGCTPDYFLRVSVKGGGCSGLSYDLDFDNELKEGDTESEDQGIKLVIDKKSLLYLLGTHLDFSDGLNGKGFQFINPNASRTCGCGESFAI